MHRAGRRPSGRNAVRERNAISGCDAVRERTAVRVGEQPVVSWRWISYFTYYEFMALNRPRLVVYPGGLAVADARLQSGLSTAEIESLVTAVERGLDPSSEIPGPLAPEQVGDPVLGHRLTAVDQQEPKCA
jgi:hypothetical protein